MLLVVVIKLEFGIVTLGVDYLLGLVLLAHDNVIFQNMLRTVDVQAAVAHKTMMMCASVKKAGKVFDPNVMLRVSIM